MNSGGNLNKLKFVDIKTPITNIDSTPTYGILKGGDRSLFKVYEASSVSNSNIQFSNLVPPSSNTFISKEILVKIPVRITFTGTRSDSDLLLQTGFDALRNLPVSNIINTAQFTINGAAAQNQISQTIQGLMRYQNDYKIRDFNSMAPNMPDYFLNYDDGVNSNRNVLAGWSDNSYENARGGFPFEVVSMDSSSAVIDVVLCETLKLSPLSFNKSYGYQNENGFWGVNSMSIYLNLVSDLGKKLWSHSDLGGTTLTNISVQVQNQCSVQFLYVTPTIEELQLQQSIPQSVYPYTNVQQFIVDGGTVAGNSTHQIISNNIQLQAIPYRIFVWAQKHENNKTVNDSDSFIPIKNVNIQLNGDSGILSDASTEQLYNICKKNGLIDSWNQFNGYERVISGTNNKVIPLSGSPLCFECGSDISLRQGFAPGMINQTNLQIQVNLRNYDTNPIPVQLYIVVMTEGTLRIEGSAAYFNTGILTQQDVLTPHEKINYSAYEYNKLYGGGFFDVLKDVGKYLGSKGDKLLDKVLDIPWYTSDKTVDIIKHGISTLPKFVPLTGGSKGVGGKRVGGKGVGGKKMKGGRMISFEELGDDYYDYDS